ncbi:MAG: tRNA pseudouridine(38-40) synthase TruA [Candidatus Eisenbacteria bacterium]
MGEERNIKLTIEYDGTEFAGWQVQPGQRTVQGALDEALSDLAGAPLSVTGAGRTDAGVHALGQVANVTLSLELEPGTLAAALNARLPDDVFVRSAHEVPPDFHARFSAVGRKYVYLIGASESPIWRLRRWHVRVPLDRDAMSEAGGMLEGERDFSSFCLTGSEPDHHRCRVTRFSLEWVPDFGGMLVVRVDANRFLRGMVRSIVGTLVDVGRGRTSPDDFRAILEAGDRGEAGATAPAHGLYLSEVIYG